MFSKIGGSKIFSSTHIKLLVPNSDTIFKNLTLKIFDFIDSNLIWFKCKIHVLLKFNSNLTRNWLWIVKFYFTLEKFLSIQFKIDSNLRVNFAALNSSEIRVNWNKNFHNVLIFAGALIILPVNKNWKHSIRYIIWGNRLSYFPETSLNLNSLKIEVFQN